MNKKMNLFKTIPIEKKNQYYDSQKPRIEHGSSRYNQVIISPRCYKTNATYGVYKQLLP